MAEEEGGANETRFFTVSMPKASSSHLSCTLEVRQRSHGAYIFRTSGLFRDMKIFERNTISRLEPGEYELHILGCNPAYIPRPSTLRFEVAEASSDSSSDSSSLSLGSLQIGHVKMDRERPWIYQSRLPPIVILVLALVLGYRFLLIGQKDEKEEKESSTSYSTSSSSSIPAAAYCTPIRYPHHHHLHQRSQQGYASGTSSSSSSSHQSYVASPARDQQIMMMPPAAPARPRPLLVPPTPSEEPSSSTTEMDESSSGEIDRSGNTPATIEEDEVSTPVKLPGSDDEWRSLFSKIYSEEETPAAPKGGGSASASRRLQPTDAYDYDDADGGGSSAGGGNSWLDEYWLLGSPDLHAGPPPATIEVEEVDSEDMEDENEEYQKFQLQQQQQQQPAPEGEIEESQHSDSRQ